MEQGIKFVITGDTKQLDQSLKQSEQSLKRYENNIASVQRSINQSSQESQNYQRAIQSLNNQLKNGQISQQQYTRALEENRNALDAADRNTVELQRELKRLQTEYNRTQRRINVTNKSLDTGGKAFQTFGRRGGSATSAVTSFSQVIQDAPYGIRGVANNIEQLSSQLIYLSQSAGGSRAAFRAFFSSLAGPAGILVAVSTVTAAIQFFSQAQQKAKKETDKLNDSLREYEENLRGVASAQLKGTQNAQSELFALEQLRKQVEDINQPMNDRLSALRQLRAEYPEYLKGMSDEQILGGQIATVYKNIADNILSVAQAKAVQDEITDNFKQQLLLESAIEAKEQELLKTRERAEKLLEKGTAVRNAQGANLYIQEAAKAEEQLNKIQKEYNELLREQGKIGSDNLNLQQRFQKILDDFDIDFTDISVSDDAVSKAIEESVDRSKNITPLEIPVTLGNLNQLDIDVIAQRAKSGGLKLVEAFKLIESGSVSAVQNIEASLEGLNRVATPQTIAFGEKMLRLQEQAKVMSDIVSAGFNAMTQQIVENLQTGNAFIDAIVSAMVGSIGELLTALITQSITEKALSKIKISTEQAKSNANAVTIATNAAAALGPAGALALPGILAAQLALVNSAFAGIQAFAQGGIVGGGQFTGDNIPIFVNSGERILTQQDQSLLTQFLRGGYANTTNRTGDMGPIRIEGVVRGDNIMLVNERATRRNRRFGSGING